MLLLQCFEQPCVALFELTNDPLVPLASVPIEVVEEVGKVGEVGDEVFYHQLYPMWCGLLRITTRQARKKWITLLSPFRCL